MYVVRGLNYFAMRTRWNKRHISEMMGSNICVSSLSCESGSGISIIAFVLTPQ
jgi:hypothetical protein